MNQIHNQCFSDITECLQFYLKLNSYQQRQIHSDHTGNMLDVQLARDSYKCQPFSMKHLKEVTIPHLLLDGWSKEEKYNVIQLTLQTIAEYEHTIAGTEFEKFRASVIRTVTEKLSLKSQNKSYQAIYIIMYKAVTNWYNENLSIVKSALLAESLDVA